MPQCAWLFLPQGQSFIAAELVKGKPDRATRGRPALLQRAFRGSWLQNQACPGPGSPARHHVRAIRKGEPSDHFHSARHSHTATPKRKYNALLHWLADF